MTTCNKTINRSTKFWWLALALAMPIFIFNALPVILKWLFGKPTKRILAVGLGTNTPESAPIVMQRGD